MKYWLVNAAKRTNCPSCDHFSVIRVLDIPDCKACEWTGSVPVDESFNPI